MFCLLVVVGALIDRKRCINFFTKKYLIMLKSASPIDIVAIKRSYARSITNNQFFERFHSLFVNAHPEIKDYFAQKRLESGSDQDQQMNMVRHGVNLVIMYIEKGENSMASFGLNRAKESHSDVPFRLYTYWRQALMQSLKEFDPKFNRDLENQWEEVLETGIGFFLSGSPLR